MVAGVFFAFSAFVMRALARLPAPQGIAAMRAINVVAVTPAFMVALFGTALACGALIFSSFHYVGPYGDRLELGSFTFRTIAGVLFSGLYLLRGFGITAWTHALYDVFLALAGLG